MAIIQELSLSSGGLSVPLQKTVQPDVPNLILGIGGEGIDALRKIRKEMLAQIEPDDRSAWIPKYQSIKMLAIDADESSLRELITDGFLEQETVSLAVPHLQALLGDPGFLANHPDFSWIDHRSPLPGNSRQVGRAMLFMHLPEVYVKLRHMIRLACEGRIYRDLRIHIITGLTGATGSGTFLDLCFLIRNILREMDMESTCRLFGYFFLPDVALTKVSDESAGCMLRKNGYAALKELEYCMDLPHNGDGFTQRYPAGISAEWNKAPVDYCHLISVTDAAGRISEDGYETAMKTVSSHVSEFLKPHQLSSVAHDYAFVLPGMLANANRSHGSYHGYLTLGAAVQKAPLTEMLTYAASLLTARWGETLSRSVLPQEVTGFASHADLAYAAWTARFAQAAGAFIPYELTRKELRSVGEQPVLLHYRDQYEQMLCKITAYQNQLTNDGCSEAPIKQICRMLDDIACRPNFGPAFAAGMLHPEQGFCLIAYIDQQLQQNTKQLHDRKLSEESLSAAYEQALQQVMSSNLFAFKRCCTEYLDTLEKFYQNKLEIEICIKIEAVLQTLKKQLNWAYKERYAPLASRMTDVCETFRSNKAIMESEAFSKGFAQAKESLLPYAEMLRLAKREADAQDTDAVFAGLCDLLLHTPEALQERRKACRLISEYFCRRLEQLTGNTVEGLLTEYYQTANTGALSNAVYQNHMMPLYHKAAPALWFDNRYFTDSKGNGFLSIPTHTAAVLDAANTLSHNVHSFVRVQPSRCDGISMLRVTVGFPLFALYEMRRYQTDFLAGQGTGAHLYEGADRDWRELPGIFPQSVCDAHSPDVDQDAARKGKTLWKEALGAGMIVKDEHSHARFFLCGFSQDAVDRLTFLKEQAGHCIEMSDGEQALMLLDEYQALIQKPDFEKSRFFIRCDAVGVDDPNIKQEMLCDYFTASPVKQQYIQTQLDTLYEANGICENLFEVVSLYRQQQEFFDALFTGQFQIGKREVGYGEICQLSTPWMEYGDLPLYQAFLSFWRLDEPMREEIKAISGLRKRTESDEIGNALNTLRDRLDPRTMLQIQDKARIHGEDARVIIDFYARLKHSLAAMCHSFGI